MCKASELIEFLKTVDPDTEVEVLRFVRIGHGHTTAWDALDLGDYSDNLDCFDYTDKEEGPYAGKKVLFLGED